MFTTIRARAIAATVASATALLAFIPLAGSAQSSPAPAMSTSGTTAKMPTCAAGDPVVWENLKSRHHVYHMAGSPMYGKTANGTYACKSDAEKAGFHAAGHHMHGHMSGAMGHHGMMMPGASSSPAASPAPAASGM